MQIVALRSTLSLLAAVGLVLGCQKQPGGPGHVAEAGPVSRPTGPLSQDKAAEYMLALVNHDRAEAGLDPVEWDETAAHAGDEHAADMAKHGYTGHWGTDGSVPEQRYTNAGGKQFVQENAACLFDAEERAVDGSAKYDPVELEKVEAAFMAEVPPNDGHKRNILKKWHNRLGVGLAMVLLDPRVKAPPCVSQEFVDDYGSFDDLPKRARVGQVVKVSGEVRPPVKFGGVGVAYVEPARPKTGADINKTSTYPVPNPYVMYYPKGFKTPKPVDVDGNRFSIEIPLSHGGKKGRYEVSVWGSYPGDTANEVVMVSLRVVDVE
jgi:uncharacterized protein YkwD